MLYELGNDAQNGHEEDDACWVETALRHEAAFEEE
jgi:hypothetical protein